MIRFFSPVWRLLFAALILLCSVSPLRAGEITIFAAASLTQPIREISANFTELTGINVRHSFAASSVLARQVINGAPADIYISANAAWMDEVESNGILLADSKQVVAMNDLVLIASDDDGWPSPADGVLGRDYPFAAVLKDTRVAIGDPQHVPAGIYTRQSLENLGVWAELGKNMVGMPDVRAALAMVERGETLFGFVYASDSQYSDKVHLVGVLPSDIHDDIVYVAGIVSSDKLPHVLSYMEFLRTSEASRKIWLANGFKVYHGAQGDG